MVKMTTVFFHPFCTSKKGHRSDFGPDLGRVCFSKKCPHVLQSMF